MPLGELPQLGGSLVGSRAARVHQPAGPGQLPARGLDSTEPAQRSDSGLGTVGQVLEPELDRSIAKLPHLRPAPIDVPGPQIEGGCERAESIIWLRPRITPHRPKRPAVPPEERAQGQSSPPASGLRAGSGQYLSQARGDIHAVANHVDHTEIGEEVTPYGQRPCGARAFPPPKPRLALDGPEPERSGPAEVGDGAPGPQLREGLGGELRAPSGILERRCKGLGL